MLFEISYYFWIRTGNNGVTSKKMSSDANLEIIEDKNEAQNIIDKKLTTGSNGYFMARVAKIIDDKTYLIKIEDKLIKLSLSLDGKIEYVSDGEKNRKVEQGDMLMIRGSKNFKNNSLIVEYILVQPEILRIKQ